MENRIYITDQSGYIKAGLAGSDEVILAWKGEYAEGDVIHMEFAKPGFYVIRVDDCVDDSLVYITQTHLRYNVLFDEKKKAHNPKAFTGERHYVALRPARPWELGYRNLAKNPADQHDVEGCYPHASANVETRGESVFAARNAIDGIVASGDIFVDDSALKAELRDGFGAAAAEMEGAAIAQTAVANGVPFVILRTISDLAEHQANVSFDELEQYAGTLAGDITVALLASL